MPKKGLTISTTEHLRDAIVRDGVVVDRNYMAGVDRNSKATISKSEDRLTLYLSLLPVPRASNGQYQVEDPNRRNHNNKVYFAILIVIYWSCLY